MPELKQVARRRRTIELRCLGMTIPQIVNKMLEENIRTSYITVRRDLKSDQAVAEREEIKRRQYADIAISDDLKVRLTFRDKMLDKLFPKQFQTSGETTHRFIWEAWKPDVRDKSEESI